MMLRIGRLDHDGYNGRDLFAEPRDEGAVVLLVAAASQLTTPEGDYLGAVLLASTGEVTNDLSQVRAETCETMFTCLTADGRTVQLMDHEIAEVIR